jgi:hypothetical protein
MECAGTRTHVRSEVVEANAEDAGILRVLVSVKGSRIKAPSGARSRVLNTA